MDEPHTSIDVLPGRWSPLAPDAAWKPQDDVRKLGKA